MLTTNINERKRQQPRLPHTLFRSVQISVTAKLTECFDFFILQHDGTFFCVWCMCPSCFVHQLWHCQRCALYSWESYLCIDFFTFVPNFGWGCTLNPETPCNVEIKVIFYMSYALSSLFQQPQNTKMSHTFSRFLCKKSRSTSEPSFSLKLMLHKRSCTHLYYSGCFFLCQ